MQVQQNKNQAVLPLQNLNLNFSKTKKHKISQNFGQNTDRSENNTPLNIGTNELNRTDRDNLLSKKKNYSDLIRERNLQTMNKKKKQSVQINQTIQDLTDRQFQETDTKENLMILPSAEDKKSLKKTRNTKSASRLTSNKSMVLLDLDPIDFVNGKDENQDYYHLRQAKSKPNQKAHKITANKLGLGKKSNISICSGVINENINFVWNNTQRHNGFADKSNLTLKAENSKLKKQLEQAQSTNRLKLEYIIKIESQANKILQTSMPLPQNIKIQQQSFSHDNSTEIIQKLRQEIIQLKKINGLFQLRSYMAEKKVIDEVAIVKKKMAREIGDWRQKCTKLRAEILKKRSQRDMTISMQISVDQE